MLNDTEVPMIATHRSLGLDLLRIVAVILVLFRHLHLPVDAPAFLNVLQRGGWVGVDLFFVLSGFLVSGLLFSEIKNNDSVKFGRFLVRRGLKIYPSFYIFIFFTIFGYAVLNRDINSRSLFGELTFLQNYNSYLWNHTWSLAVEEHFYLFLCLIFYIANIRLKDSNMACIPAVFYIIAAVCLLLRLSARQGNEPFSFHHHLFPTHLRIDSLMFGTFISYLFHYKELGSRIKRIPTPLLVTTGTLLLTPAFVFSLEAYSWVSTVGLDLFALGSGILVIASLRCPTSSHPILRLGGTLGASSYCIYLWHMPVNNLATWLFERQGHLHFLPYLAFYFSGSLIFGHVFSRLTEIPILHLRDRLFPDSRLNKI